MLRDKPLTQKNIRIIKSPTIECTKLSLFLDHTPLKIPPLLGVMCQRFEFESQPKTRFSPKNCTWADDQAFKLLTQTKNMHALTRRRGENKKSKRTIYSNPPSLLTCPIEICINAYIWPQAKTVAQCTCRKEEDHGTRLRISVEYS